MEYLTFVLALLIGAGGIIVWWTYLPEEDDEFDDLLNGYDYYDGPRDDVKG